MHGSPTLLRANMWPVTSPVWTDWVCSLSLVAASFDHRFLNQLQKVGLCAFCWHVSASSSW
jgi:hypothetical protein